MKPIKWFQVSAKDSVHLQIYDCVRFAVAAHKSSLVERWKINCKLWLFYCFIWSTTDLLLLSCNERVPLFLQRFSLSFFSLSLLYRILLECTHCMRWFFFSCCGSIRFCCHCRSVHRCADEFYSSWRLCRSSRFIEITPDSMYTHKINGENIQS